MTHRFDQPFLIVGRVFQRSGSGTQWKRLNVLRYVGNMSTNMGADAGSLAALEAAAWI